jgi:hypothetical protein
LIPRVETVPRFASPWPCVDRCPIAMNEFLSAQV